MSTARRNNRDSIATRPMTVTIALVIAFGGLLLPVVGWIAGITMMWLSPVWSAKAKTVVTVLPVAVASICAFSAVVMPDGIAGWHTALLTLCIVPIATGLWLLVDGLRRATTR